MKKIINQNISTIILIIFCCAGLNNISFGQQKDQNRLFVYIQNENGSPFYVKTNDTLLSSTQAGYMILPKLKEGNHTLTIGFPKKQLAEASFNIHLKGSGDMGFMIKENNQSFLLYNIQNGQAVEPVQVASSPGNRIITSPEPETQPEEPEKQQEDTTPATSIGQPVAVASPQKIQEDSSPAKPESNPFEEMLNAVTGTNEPSTPQTEEPAVQQPAQGEDSTSQTLEKLLSSTNEPEPAEPVRPPDSNSDEKVSSEGDTIAFAENNPPSGNEPAPEIKKPEKNTELSFITFPSDSTDTEVVVPKEQKSVPQEKVQPQPEEKSKPRESIDDLFANIFNSDTMAKENEMANEDKEENSEIQPQTHIINSDCKHQITKEEFQKVRRKVASRTDGESMYRVAEKYFSGGVCYSTSQVQSLAYLFMNDEYRFKFLEVAYPHVYDSNKFSSLINTLSSDYYRGRFKAMVR